MRKFMKYFGSTLRFTESRNNDLMRVYRSLISKTDYINVIDIFEQVALSPASRFWVSEDRAAAVISAMHSGKKLPAMLPNKREMFEEIYRRFLKERQLHPDKSLYWLVATVVNQPAPKFYFTPRTVGEIIYRIKNGWYDRPRKSCTK